MCCKMILILQFTVEFRYHLALEVKTLVIETSLGHSESCAPVD